MLVTAKPNHARPTKELKFARPPPQQPPSSSCLNVLTGMVSNGVTVMKFRQLLMILELYLELSYFLSQIFIVVTVIEVTKVPKFLI